MDTDILAGTHSASLGERLASVPRRIEQDRVHMEPLVGQKDLETVQHAEGHTRILGAGPDIVAADTEVHLDPTDQEEGWALAARLEGNIE